MAGAVQLTPAPGLPELPAAVDELVTQARDFTRGSGARDGEALTSRGTPGKRIALRFKASDNSGRASVAITVFVGKHPYGYLRTSLKSRRAPHVYTTQWSSPDVRGQLRFCAEAYDPSGNESAPSCAAIVTT